MSKKAITNANIVLENGIIWDGVLIIENGKIADFGCAREIKLPEGAEIIDAGGAYVGPGFVDIHVHGCTGMNNTDRPLEVYEHFLRHGETTMLITPAYRMSVEQYVKTAETARDAMKKNSGIKGVYMEGPFINPKSGAGAHLNPWHGGIPEDARKTIIDAFGDIARVWAIAPEREDVMDVVTHARALNPDCVFTVAHSEATPAQIRAMGTRYRPAMLTHYGCATGRLPVYGGTRGYGPDEYCFSDNEMYAELISDSCGVHVHPDNQKMLSMISDEKFKEMFTLMAEKGIGYDLSVWNFGLDDPENCQMFRIARIARDCGVKFLFGTDTHTVDGLKWAHRSTELFEKLPLTKEDLHPMYREYVK